MSSDKIPSEVHPLVQRRWVAPVFESIDLGFQFGQYVFLLHDHRHGFSSRLIHAPFAAARLIWGFCSSLILNYTPLVFSALGFEPHEKKLQGLSTGFFFLDRLEFFSQAVSFLSFFWILLAMLYTVPFLK